MFLECFFFQEKMGYENYKTTSTTLHKNCKKSRFPFTLWFEPHSRLFRKQNPAAELHTVRQAGVDRRTSIHVIYGASISLANPYHVCAAALESLHSRRTPTTYCLFESEPFPTPSNSEACRAAIPRFTQHSRKSLRWRDIL